MHCALRDATHLLCTPFHDQAVRTQHANQEASPRAPCNVGRGRKCRDQQLASLPVSPHAPPGHNRAGTGIDIIATHGDTTVALEERFDSRHMLMRVRLSLGGCDCKLQGSASIRKVD